MYDISHHSRTTCKHFTLSFDILSLDLSFSHFHAGIQCDWEKVRRVHTECYAWISYFLHRFPSWFCSILIGTLMFDVWYYGNPLHDMLILTWPFPLCSAMSPPPLSLNMRNPVSEGVRREEPWESTMHEASSICFSQAGLIAEVHIWCS